MALLILILWHDQISSHLEQTFRVHIDVKCKKQEKHDKFALT